MKGAAREQTGAALQQIKEGAESATRQAREMGSSLFDTQRQNLVHRVESYAESAHKAADCLRAGEGSPLAGAVLTAADQLTRVSEYLRDKKPADVLHDLEGFARRRPEIVFGGMFLLGLTASRFLKASAPRPKPEPWRSDADGGYDRPDPGVGSGADSYSPAWSAGAAPTGTTGPSTATSSTALSSQS